MHDRRVIKVRTILKTRNEVSNDSEEDFFTDSPSFQVEVMIYVYVTYLRQRHLQHLLTELLNMQQNI